MRIPEDAPPGPRNVEVVVIPLPLANGKTPPEKRVVGEAVAPLNEAVRHRLEGADETRRRLAPVVDALLTQIRSWEAEGQTPASIRVDARVKGDVACEFALCHCEQRGTVLGWIERLKWKRTLRQPCGEMLGVLRGPAADEPDFHAGARRTGSAIACAGQGSAPEAVAGPCTPKPA